MIRTLRFVELVTAVISLIARMRDLNTGSARVGQINGLCVVDVGRLSFGHLTRITAPAS